MSERPQSHAANPVAADSTKTNRLGQEKSPYLLQHKDNPVWWQPWGQAAFASAKAQDKPIFLSVGYSTCHWCHVMERESFEQEDVAELLNQSFVSIKVDREERPDVDDIYMNAVMAMTNGRGGWPMSVWLTPDGRPFFGGTYFPKEKFKEILRALASAWRTDRARIEQVGGQLAVALTQREEIERGGALTQDNLVEFYQAYRAAFDPVYGGDRGAPKFPSAYAMRLLLRIHRRSGNSQALMMVRTTLDQMARGGIYDHVGGGFHRYSTDERWFVPHFEKMLYDQASLASAYVEAYQATGEQEYAAVAREILDYVLRDMTHPEGAFYSAEDADSEGQEGKFYVWTDEELRRLLTVPEHASIAETFGVTAQGNFEHKANIFSLRPGHFRSTRPETVRSALKKLFAARSRRIHPHRDDKILTSWNGLMIAAAARAGVALGEPRYLAAASRAARFVTSRLRTSDGRLLARWRDGEARFAAYVDDYAFMIDGLIELYQADFDKEWILEALRLQKLQDAIYSDPRTGAYFFTDGSDRTLLSRGTDFYDNVRPSGNSVSCLNLLRLADLTADPSWTGRVPNIFDVASRNVARSPGAFSQLLMSLDYSLDRSKEIAVVGDPSDPGTRRLLDALRAGFNPNKVITAGIEDPAPLGLMKGKLAVKGKPTAYICENGVCKLPTPDPSQARRLAEETKTFMIEAK